MAGELHVDHIVVTYSQPGGKSLTAVDDVSLTIRSGEVVGLVGESGCGKSTTARAICGLTPVASGSIAFDGIPVEPLKLSRRPSQLQRVQMVFQNPYASLNPHRRVGQQIEDARKINPRVVPSIPELLERVGLDASAAGAFPHQFSGGQRQRIAIARAVASGPEVLIGDEPIASLDASLQARIAALMRAVALDTGASLLFISHDLAVVRTIADRVMVMNQGKIVEEGPTEQVWTNPQDPYTRRLLAAIPAVDGLGRIPQVDEGA